MRILVLIAILLVSYSGFSQPAPAKSGVSYGEKTTADQSISATELSAKMNNGKFNGKITGTVTEVCQEKGCWMKLDNGGNEPLMVKFKDYGFFMPKDIVGKKVVLDGEALTKEVSVKQQKHYAEDAGKSKEEIGKITKPKKEVQFIAKGVLVI